MLLGGQGSDSMRAVPHSELHVAVDAGGIPYLHDRLVHLPTCFLGACLPCCGRMMFLSYYNCCGSVAIHCTDPESCLPFTQ